jgi:hypothetical protein
MATRELKRASSYEETAPLVDLCKAGKLFAVRDWIDSGKPVNPPPHGKGTRKKSPLEYAIASGFHSLVEVLLKGGASLEPDGGYCPMNHALATKRFDVVTLLVEHGYDPRTVDMRDVFDTWEPEIMEYFIERGADVEANMPLASALCQRIRTALRIFRGYRDRFPTFQEQANIALRHHCKEGNLKWVSLMIWAGADPLAPGSSEPNDACDPEDAGLSALGWAALYNHYEVFSLRKVKFPVDHPAAREVLRYGGRGVGIEVIEKLLTNGLNPNDQPNGGCSAIQQFITRLDWGGFSDLIWERRRSHIDSNESRDYLKSIHLLARHGGKWIPCDQDELKSARRSLLKMTPDYTLEFVWIMAKYHACSKAHIEALLRTPSMKRHVSEHRARLGQMLAEWPQNEVESSVPV